MAGITVIANKIEANSAKDFVKASGRNNFPSAACIVNTGKKLTIVVATAVITADATSTVAMYTVFFMD